MKNAKDGLALKARVNLKSISSGRTMHRLLWRVSRRLSMGSSLARGKSCQHGLAAGVG
jgi:hypothetical protein